jgi:16S rRNA (cytidine1402-2'-O)-methyltransferase
VAGVPTERFCFEGFLPSKPREREARLESLVRESRTLVLFEAPHRIADTLADCVRVLGAERRAAVARELTKVFETVYRGSLGELAARAAAEEDFRRGEITVVIAGAEALPVADAAQRDLLERVLQQALEYLPASKAAALAAAVSGGSREEAYALAVSRAAARRGDG